MGIIADVAALARAGYTMADIRELMQTKEPEEPKEPEAPKEPEKPKEPEAPKEPETPKDETDYKAKYQELLAKTQADNRKENFGGAPDNRTDEQKAIDILAAIF
jgi:outer membrane biosynthesis protein TonB